MREGDIVMIGPDVRAVILQLARTSLLCEVKSSGIISTNSVVKIPAVRAQNLPVLQLEDKVNIKEVAIKHSFDYIAVPCVLTSRDLQEMRIQLGAEAKNMQILAKIDSLEAVQNFVSILKQADGIIILRDELAMELDCEKLVLA